MVSWLSPSDISTEITGNKSRLVAEVYQQEEAGNKLNVDIEKSIITWKGTKLRRMGSHEGTLSIMNGSLYFDKGKLAGGSIIADMHTITVTDIPPHEVVPIRNITDHLNADFETDVYPVSKFEITDVDYSTGEAIDIRGELTIKDVTKPITIQAEVMFMDKSTYRFSSSFSFNRFDWNIGTEGSWLEKKLVDEDITLRVEIVTE